MTSPAELAQWVIDVTVLLSLQLLLILSIRKPAHSIFGATSVYRLWLLPLVWSIGAWLLNLVSADFFLPGLNDSVMGLPPATTLLQSYETSAEFSSFSVRLTEADMQGLQFLWPWLAMVWITISTLLFMTLVVRGVMLHRHISKAATLVPGDNLAAILRTIGFPDELPVRVVADLQAPAIYGLRRRTLLLPSDFTYHFAEDQQHAILRHEYAHYRRFDNLANAIALGLRNLFWFNPVMWLAYNRFRLDQELSCDCAALCGVSQGHRKRYAEALLNSVSGKQYSPREFGLAPWGEAQDVKQRTRSINHHHRHGAGAVSRLVSLSLIIALGTGMSSILYSQDRAAGVSFPAELIPGNYLQQFSQFNQSNSSSIENEDRRSQTVPLDSHFVAFVLDTSGSMFNTPGSWDVVMAKIGEVLDAFPNLEGFQIVNDMGEYLFNRYRREWIVDTPERRSQIMSTLFTWNPYSNSSPVEGLAEILTNLAASRDSVSIFVIGDDLQPDLSIEAIIENIESYNRPAGENGFIARIHSIMLPNIFLGPPDYQEGAFQYARLMRYVASRNGGSFELVDYQP